METVRRLRQTFHDAYIVEAKLGRHSAVDGKLLPPTLEYHRSLDAPTLNVVKAPQYPFLLCEEAPQSYNPPPVPFAVGDEVEQLKGFVMQVQEDLQRYQVQLKRDKKTELTKEETLQFFLSSALFMELAWKVTYLQSYYRWVLSHSISHLWNAKEQLEYVLTENDQDLPETAEMDACLSEFPFSDAVSILEKDRQSIIAQERRRLQSNCRTYHENMPPATVTGVTSCYLTTEEKYMYQEFFNQSEHLLLLLSHTIMLNQAKARDQAGSTATSFVRWSGADGIASNSSSPARMLPRESGDVVPRNPESFSEIDTSAIAQEALSAVAAEQEVMATLMRKIEDRRAKNEYYDISEEEYNRSRRCQIAVYGCVLSDMALMADQMNISVGLIEKYEDWLRYRGFNGHQDVMSELSKRSGGAIWPSLSMLDASCCARGDSHGHFIPPTEEMFKGRLSGHERRTPSNFPDRSTPRLTESPTPPPAVPRKQPVAATKAPPQKQRSAPTATSGSRERAVPSAATVDSSNDIASAFYNILVHVTKEWGCRSASIKSSSAASLERWWMAAVLRYTFVKTLRREWRISEFTKILPQAEEDLLTLLRRNSQYEYLQSNAAALLAILREVAQLATAKPSPRAQTVEVPFVLHMIREEDDMKREVEETLTTVELVRWNALLDALWFQVDPSAAANGDLLLSSATASARESLTLHDSSAASLGFLFVETLGLPPIRQTKGVATVVLRYRLPWLMTAAASPSRRVAPVLSTIAEAQQSSVTELDRYVLARRVLSVLNTAESKGLLPCFACRISEVTAAPLSQAMFISFEDESGSLVVPKRRRFSVSMLPPAALALRRIHSIIGSRAQPLGQPIQPFAVYEEAVSFSSIGLMVAALFTELAVKPKMLEALYLMAESVREQAQWELRNRVVSKSFAAASVHPVPISCAPAKNRAISIQRESVVNRNSTSLRRFVSPLLRHIDDVVAAMEKEQGSNRAKDEAEVKTPRSALPAARRTELIGPHNTSNASPSPSAVRPTRR